MKKRLLSILLVFIITISMIPVYGDTSEEYLNTTKAYANYQLSCRAGILSEG